MLLWLYAIPSFIGTIAAGTEIEVKNADGNTVTTGTIDLGAPYDGYNVHDVVIMFYDEISEAGTYTVTIPEATVYDESDDLYNPELQYTFTVDPTLSGISGITVGADGTVKVYTIDGVYVGSGEATKMVDSLPKGVYIINGAKVTKK